MRIPSFAQLKSFIRRVLGLPMPSLFDSVFDAQVNEATMPVDPVLRLYIAARGRRSSDLESTLSDSPVRIQTVRLMKRLNTRFEHEYLVADLVSGNGRRTNVIVIGELKVERAYDSRHGNALKNASADASRASSDSTPGPSTPSGSSPLSAMFNIGDDATGMGNRHWDIDAGCRRLEGTRRKAGGSSLRPWRERTVLERA